MYLQYSVYLTLRRRAFFPPGFVTPDGTHAHHHSSPEPQRRVVPAPGPPPLTTDFEQKHNNWQSALKTQPLRKRAIVECQAPKRSPKRPSAALTGPGRFCGSDQ